MPRAEEEIDTIQAAVSRRFHVYGVVVTPLALTFQVSVPTGSADEAFDDLRRELIPKDYIPSLTRERGELLLHVQRRPSQRFTRIQVNLIMLLLTIATTVFFGGAYTWSVYTGVDWLSLGAIANGALYFAVPLLAILGFHEMGHYVVAKRHHIKASLPFFIPSIPPLGTFGAFISMRDPLPDRRSLLDVGASGPLVGFAIAIPVTLAGLFLTAANPQPVLPTNGTFEFVQPSLFYGFLSLFFPIPANQALHPLAFAGWVGLFVTAINLLPASQLDGGHIARALLGTRQHYASWISFLFLMAMSFVYPGWLIFALFIFFIGLRHPPPLNDLGTLGARRTVVGILAVVVLIATFVPVPFALVQARPGVAFETPSGAPLSAYNASAAAGSTALLTFAVNDTSVLAASVRLSFDPGTAQNLRNAGFNLTFSNVTIDGNATVVNGSAVSFGLREGQHALVAVSVTVPPSAAPSVTWVFAIRADVTNGPTAELPVNLTVT